MDLFIRIKDGQPFEHPIMGDNFREAFPHIDVNNLPAEFAKFERIERPIIGVYEIYEGVTYEFHDEIWKDIHHIRQMTAEEKTAQIEQVLAQPHPAGWVFNENMCAWLPPIPNVDAPGEAPNVIG
jgi:hypothetical protein